MMTAKRLKIAIIHQPWSIVRPNQRGADSVGLWTDQVSRRLARDFQVVTYSRQAEGLPASETADGVEFRRVPARLDRYVKFAFGKLDRMGLRNVKRPFFASKFAYRQFIAQVARHLRSLRPDVVHIHNFSQFVPIVRSAVPDAKIGLHMHCEWLTQLERDAVAARIAHADAVIGVSDFLAGKIRDRFPEHARRVCRVYNGADVERFSNDGSARGAEGMKHLLYVGRVSPEKGVHTLLDAFAIVARQRSDVKLTIVGPERVVPFEMIVPFCDDPKVLELADFFRGGAYIEHLRAQVRSLPSDRIDFSEQEVPHDQLPQIYAAADVFVIPSIWDEPFGMPLVEAMAAGCAPIATRNGAFPEIIEDESSGLLIERADPQTLAAEISRLCGDDALRARISAAAQQRARERFTWSHVARSLLEVYGIAPADARVPAAVVS